MLPEGERATELLQFANFRKVGDAVGVSRSQVAQWAQGKQVTPYRLGQLEELLAHSAPLSDQLDAIQRAVESNAKELAVILAILEANGAPVQPSPDAPPDARAPVR